MTYSAVELPDKPGYYAVPDNSRYWICKDGYLWDTLLNKAVPLSINSSGYLMCTLKGDDGVRRTFGLHRLLALTFLRGSSWQKGLVVNHINGNKRDNRLENLEWVTYRENAEHAGKYGLSSKCLPISVRDVFTGEVVAYPSITAAAECLGLSKDAVNYRVFTREGKVYPEGKQYRAGHDDKPWPIPIDSYREMLNSGRAKPVQCRWLLTGEIKTFVLQTDLANFLGLSCSTLSQWLSQPNQPVLPGLIQLKSYDDSIPWRHVDDPYAELKSVVVKVINDKTGDIQCFESAKQCADYMGISPTALDYRLKSRGTKVFKDGYRYSYYSDTQGPPL